MTPPPKHSQSVVEPGFWAALGDLKLRELGLGEGPVAVAARLLPANRADLPGLVTLDPASLSVIGGGDSGSSGGAGREGGTEEESAASVPAVGGGAWRVRGEAHVLNTAEQLTSFDRKGAAQRVKRACSTQIGGLKLPLA